MFWVANFGRKKKKEVKKTPTVNNANLSSCRVDQIVQDILQRTCLQWKVEVGQWSHDPSNATSNRSATQTFSCLTGRSRITRLTKSQKGFINAQNYDDCGIQSDSPSLRKLACHKFLSNLVAKRCLQSCILNLLCKRASRIRGERFCHNNHVYVVWKIPSLRAPSLTRLLGDVDADLPERTFVECSELGQRRS